MQSDILKEARAQLDHNLDQFGITLSHADKEAAASAVVAQFQKLNPDAKSATETEKTQNAGFAKEAVQDLLLNVAVTPEITVEQAQKETGCFRSVFDPPKSPNMMHVAVKDIFRFGGHHPTAGLASPPEDLDLPETPLISRLRTAGAHIAATTKLSAWCYLPIELNEQVPPPRNPLGDGLLVGGSSSGSAVAVASGAVQIGVGSDTGGSIRIPAALCGVYGFKPSRGAIPVQGSVPLGETQDTIGLIAKSPVSIQSTFEVLTTQPEKTATPREKPIAGIPNELFAQASPNTKMGLNGIIVALRQLGLECGEVAELDLDRMNATAGLITGYEAGIFHAPRIAKYPEQYPTSVQKRLMVGLAVPNTTYEIAQANRATCVEHVDRSIFAHCDWILAPVINRDGLTISEWGADGDLQAIGKLSLELLSLNRWVNLLGLPSISIPVSGDDLVPAAVQVVGKFGSDCELLKLACELDAVLRDSFS